MTADWTLIVAQVANFLILVWLLRRFLYNPVKRVIAERERRIDETRRRAAEQMEAARAQEAAYREKAAEIEAEKERILSEAAAAAEAEKTRRLEAAAAEAEKVRFEMLRALQEERRELEQRLREDLVSQTCATAGKVIHDLTGLELANALIAKAQQALEEAPGPNGSPKAGGGPLEVRTSFPPTEEQMARLERMARRWAGDGGALEVVFSEDPSLLLGIEFVGDGESVSWSARDRLAEIEGRALAALGEADGVGDA